MKNPNSEVKDPGWFFKSFFLIAVAGTLLTFLIIGGVYWHFSRNLPKIITVADYRPLAVTRLLSSDGQDENTLGEFYKERRYLIPYEKIPTVVVQAFISAEDDKFFEHPGINVSSMIRASIANFRAGHVVQGGSTITQQVAKSLLLTPERSFVRKIKEVILANRIERHLSKPQILYLYLNQIYLGHGAYGVQAASKTYFRKDISKITLAEAALLGGMPQAPGKYSPFVNSKKSKERQLYVLRRMFENKYITQTQLNEATAQNLSIYHDEDLNSKYASYLVEHVRRYLVEKYGEKAVYEDGLTVTLPTNKEFTSSSAKSVKEGLKTVDKRIGYRGPLQHLTTIDEIEKFLKDYRLKIMEHKVHSQTLMTDGRMDPVEAMHRAGIMNEASLLDVNETYQAVVTSLDDQKKQTGVMIGAVRAELPLDRMRWARPAKEDKGNTSYHGDPSRPSGVFSKGDVILVRVVTNSEAGVSVALDQDPKVQGALFSLESQTGHVLAMEGGYDFDESEFNRATQAERQPGSSFKPIIYSAGLEKGYTPATILVDSPLVYEDSESGKWKPSNFEEKFYGDTTFRQALIKSRNVPTIKIVQSIGVPYVIQYAQRLGMTSAKFNADLSISLGSASVSLMEMTKVYALYPRLGRKVTPVFVTKVVDRDGKILEEEKLQSLPSQAKIASIGVAAPSGRVGASPGVTPSPSPSVGVSANGLNPIAMPSYPPSDDPDQILDPRVAYVMTHLMKEVVNYGTGHEAKSLNRGAAGKTGTTNEYLDAWFMGFTPHVVTGVWVGFDNQKSIGPGETGARAALPIWLSYMKEAVKPYPESDFPIPPGVVFASIDPTSGKLAPANSSSAIQEAFIEGTQPTETADSTRLTPATQSDFFKEDTE